MVRSRSALSDAEKNEPEDPAEQDLPGADTESLSPWALARLSALGNACAVVKSAEILLGGARVCNAAAFALALTAIEDWFVLHRARQSCRSTAALLAVEQDHAARMIHEAARRLGLVGRIAREVGQEACDPLRVRLDLMLENLRRVSFL
jgi:hypothetical protein